jgi:actin-related protein
MKEFQIPGNDNFSKFFHERFQCPEALFQPEKVGIDTEGIQNMLFKSIKACPLTSRRPLLGQIILSGGSTLFPGLPERLEKEIKELCRENKMNPRDVKITALSNRKYLAWVGAAVLGGMTTLLDEEKCTKDYFDENGNIHLDEVYNTAKTAIRKSGQIQMFGIIFSESDVDKLYSFIKGNN